MYEASLVFEGAGHQRVHEGVSGTCNVGFRFLHFLQEFPGAEKEGPVLGAGDLRVRNPPEEKGAWFVVHKEFFVGTPGKHTH